MKRIEDEVAFYNIAPGRNAAQVAGEIHAIAHGRLMVGLVEAIGYDNHVLQVGGYRLIRDRSRPSRANVAALVADGHKVRGVRWHDLRSTWPRTERGGWHEPRSWVSFRLDGMLAAVYHAPPVAAGDKAQAEGIDSLIEHFRRRPGRVRRNARPVLIVMDSNDHDLSGPKRLAEAIGGRVVGGRIDCAVVRDAGSGGASYAARERGVRLLTDHVGRLALRVKVAASHLRPPSPSRTNRRPRRTSK